MKKIGKNILVLLLIVLMNGYVFFPAPTSAQGVTTLAWAKNCPSQPQNFQQFICTSLNIIELLIAFAASAAVLAFVWGLSKFIFSAGEEEKIAEGKMIMKWGLVGLFFMFTIWGVIWVLTTGFGFDFGIPLLPQ